MSDLQNRPGHRRVGRARRAALLGVVAAVAATATLVASPWSHATGPALVPPAVPTTGAYLGAFVAPGISVSYAEGDARIELANVDSFTGKLGRPLGIAHVYQGWASPVQNSLLDAIANSGAIPLIDWVCPPPQAEASGTVSGDQAVVDGDFDPEITAFAQQLAAYGRPVFLRWFWEMNFVSLQRNLGCLGLTKATAQIPSDVAAAAATFVQAWQHIWSIFDTANATNVAFVWNASASTSADPDLAQFWPGASYVNWTGFDNYYRPYEHQANKTTNPYITVASFLATSDAVYNQILSLPGAATLPMMWGETGAQNAANIPAGQANPTAVNQAALLDQLATYLPATMPDLHALLYYDNASDQDWTLQDTTGDPGLSAFQTLADTPYYGYPFTTP